MGSVNSSRYGSLAKTNGGLKLLHVNKRNHDLLSITRLVTIFDAYDSEEEAVKSFDRPAGSAATSAVWPRRPERLRPYRERGLCRLRGQPREQGSCRVARQIRDVQPLRQLASARGVHLHGRHRRAPIERGLDGRPTVWILPPA